ncbi:SEC-C motif-containing protein [Scopulibacillus darangshiensis]|uniref:SEC-C motif-containing protein n=1 Tax=Scopulibacillus darangshiensis TaxID=442528 RepID=A0A4R2NF71_9BACL|nr:HEAT repeat domain-containing protein [Scopulibacillus darangshiensis]TCP19933.1 SEC-C motif-containing protein [Scopulibacillus darangshiensis]
MIQPHEVKSFLLHEDGEVRLWAVKYFVKGNVPGENKLDIMPLILESVKKYPDQTEKNNIILSYAAKLPLATDSIEMIIANLTADKNYEMYYAIILSQADPRPVLPYLDDLRRLIPNGFIKIIQSRHDFTDKDTESLWEELINFGNDAAGKYINEFNYSYGKYLAWELAKRSDLPSEKILNVFHQDKEISIPGYTEIYLAMILGIRKEKKAVPTLLEWLAGDGDLECEVAVESLVKIGDIESVTIIKDRFINEDNEGFRTYASGMLGKIKHPKSEEALIDLLEEDWDDNTLVTYLADALCELVSVDGIPIVKKIVEERHYVPGILDLKESLYCTCMIVGIDIPEFNNARQSALLTPNQSYVRKGKIGRNDPCPCGSGKKYKKCCGR